MNEKEKKAHANFEELRDCITIQDVDFGVCLADALKEIMCAGMRHDIHNIEWHVNYALNAAKEYASERMRHAQLKKQRAGA